MRGSRVVNRAGIITSAAAALGMLMLFCIASAAQPPKGEWPWGKLGPQVTGYEEPTPPSPPPATVTQPPAKYVVQIVILPEQDEKNKGIGQVMAHLPESARLWFNDAETKSRGRLRILRTPPLAEGYDYEYTARMVWAEDGKWVTQTKKVPVRAGATTCLYIVRPAAPLTALSKLDPADRKAAEKQRFCAVQRHNRLGALGVPYKLIIKGQVVFLCCEGCRGAALRDPERTLANVKELVNSASPKKR